MEGVRMPRETAIKMHVVKELTPSSYQLQASS